MYNTSTHTHTHPDLKQAAYNSNHDITSVKNFTVLYDYKSWLSPYINTPHYHTTLTISFFKWMLVERLLWCTGTGALTSGYPLTQSLAWNFSRYNHVS